MATPQTGEMYRGSAPALGARLFAAARQVAPHRPVADIGCDHGKLAVWLALKAGAPKVIAVDNRPMPLAAARALVQKTGCGAVVHCRLGQGLAPLAPLEATELVVAGLSGETIVGILAAHGWVKHPNIHLVLVPTTRHAHLRHYLCKAGFAIDFEEAVLEKGRCYTALSARYTGQSTSPGPLFYQLGLVPAQKGEAAQAYIRARLAQLHKSGLGPMDAAEQAAHDTLVREVEACLR